MIHSNVVKAQILKAGRARAAPKQIDWQSPLKSASIMAARMLLFMAAGYGRRSVTGISMRDCFKILIAVVVPLLWLASSDRGFATGAEPDKEPQIDPAPCFAAISANDDDKIATVCGALIENDKTAKADRIKALIACA